MPQEASKAPSAVLEFALSRPDASGDAAHHSAFPVEFSKAELQGLLEKLDRVQSQLDSLSAR
jgi:hypothetical protein